MRKELSMGKNLSNNQPQGSGECILDYLEKLGAVPVDIQIQILQEKNQHILRTWIKLAREVKSVEQFIQKMQDIYPRTVILLISQLHK